MGGTDNLRFEPGSMRGISESIIRDRVAQRPHNPIAMACLALVFGGIILGVCSIALALSTH